MRVSVVLSIGLLFFLLYLNITTAKIYTSYEEFNRADYIDFVIRTEVESKAKSCMLTEIRILKSKGFAHRQPNKQTYEVCRSWYEDKLNLILPNNLKYEID